MAAVTIADIRAARRRVAPHLVHTPLSAAPALGRRAGIDLRLKQENRQLTGSFKPRGALNQILGLDAAERGRGVVAASAGNHALGVAHACRVAGIGNARLFVQANASPAKLARLATYPIPVERVGHSFEEAQQAARAEASRSGALYLSPYEDPAVVAGHGTVGLEIAEDWPEVDTVLVPTGGGALLAGIAVALAFLRPGIRIVAVNPAASPSALESLRAGRALDPYDHAPTLAHGIAGGFGRLPFALARQLIAEVVLVSEAEMAEAMAALIDSEQILAEPSGAAAVAAALHGRGLAPGERAVAVISGGNVDAHTLGQVLAAARPAGTTAAPGGRVDPGAAPD